MKKLIFIFAIIIPGAMLFAQQAPLSENYFMDRYSLASSYAGNFNKGYLVTGYRSDWSGIEGGPKTFRLSYNDSFAERSGYGARIIFDKAGIFNQLYIMGSYSYRVNITDDHLVMFGLSAGMYSNKISLSDYYNDPDYNIDPALINQDVRSKLKFMTDISAVYSWQGLNAGFLFSNISFGDATYSDVNLQYNPLANFQFHASYLWNFTENWELAPLVVVRAGKNIRSQFELASQVIYMQKVWGSLVFRDPGILGVGIGANIDRGFKLAYNFNFATSVELGAFNSHEFSLGVNIFEYIGK